MRNGYNVDIIISVDTQEFVKIGGKVANLLEGVNYKDNFKRSRFRKVIQELFKLRQKYKDEGNDLKQKFVKILLNSSYGEKFRKDITAEKAYIRTLDEYRIS